MSKVDYYDDSAPAPAVDEAVLAKLATRSSLTPDSAKLILVMVGLPARGKSFISSKLQSFLQWSGKRTQIFNAGQKRRQDSSPDLQSIERQTSSAKFFDPSDAGAKAQREAIAMETLEALLQWFEQEDGDVGILDATNSTRDRRAAVVARAAAESARTGESVAVVFIESVCDEAALLEANMLAKVRASPDFKGLSEADALADLKERIGHYEGQYETVEDQEGAYIKLFNLSSKVAANQVFGRMSQRVLPYLAALHIRPRPIYLAALLPGAGEAARSSDSSFAHKLAHFATVRAAAGENLRLLSSTQPAALAAADAIGCTVTHQSGLNPLDRGRTMGDGDASSPAVEALLARMKFDERFPGGGESFADLVRRLWPCVLEIEASMEPVLVLAHAGPCRALRAYFKNLHVVECMGAATSPGSQALANHSHKVVSLVPNINSGGFVETIIDLEDGPGASTPLGISAVMGAPGLDGAYGDLS